MTARATDTFKTLVVNVSTAVTEQSELREMGLCKTDKRGIPVYREKCVTESQRSRNTSPGARQQMDMSNYQYHGVDNCFGVCGKTDSANCPDWEELLATALRLQCDGSRLLTNIQDMKLLLASLHEAASAMLRVSLADEAWSSS